MTRKLKGLRVLNGIDIGKVAELLGISIDAYRRRENGNTEFVNSEISKLVKFFRVKYEDIFLEDAPTECGSGKKKA